MRTRPIEAAIDRIVASCGGDIRGALEALLLVNEHLEAELQQLYAAVAVGGDRDRSSAATARCISTAFRSHPCSRRAGRLSGNY